jgi:CDP-paratose 2-epimerase
MIARTPRANGAPKSNNGSSKSNHHPSRNPPRQKKVRGPGSVLITGGSGFIGTNVANRLLREGHHVVIYDNLSRPGVEQNLRWLQQMHGGKFDVEIADVRDFRRLNSAVRKAAHVFHFAAQVAVTSSLTNPFHDFDVNARGTLNLLEAIRNSPHPPSLLFTSTNKVYGGLPDVPLVQKAGRYEPAEELLRAVGVSESRPLDFHSPYGCSKGAADQYIIDFSRTFSIPTVVFRMSCIYGEHQCGNEDQGWVAHFVARAMQNKTLTIFGDGKQVRDILFAEDLVEAMLLARRDIHTLAGQPFYIGGGPDNTISLMELLESIERMQGRPVKLAFKAWRPGDQRYYVSDTRKFQRATGWQPQVSVETGLTRLHEWVQRWRRATPATRLKERAGFSVPKLAAK